MEKNFYFQVLYDEYFSFGLKRRILEKIVNNIDTQQVQDLNRLSTIRNYFAHCGTELIPAPFNNKKAQIIDPRDIQKEIDFEKLHNEFMSRAGNVELYLFEVYKNLGGEFKTASELLKQGGA